MPHMTELTVTEIANNATNPRQPRAFVDASSLSLISFFLRPSRVRFQC